MVLFRPFPHVFIGYNYLLLRIKRMVHYLSLFQNPQVSFLESAPSGPPSSDEVKSSNRDAAAARTLRTYKPLLHPPLASSFAHIYSPIQESSIDNLIESLSQLYTFNDDLYAHLFQLTLDKRFSAWREIGDDSASDNYKVRTLQILRTLMRSDAITASLAGDKASLGQIFELFDRI